MSSQGWRAVAADDFSVAAAVGGVRGMVESALPGVVFVVAYLVWGGFQAPTIAALGTVAAMVTARLVQRTPVTQALGGVLGVAIGAVWAWRFADPGEYFVPGFWIAGAYLAGLVATMLVRWPAVGVLVSVLRGSGTAWRQDRRAMRVYQAATAVLAGLFALKLAVQLPLYFAGEIAAVGVARIVTGLPAYALAAWIIWRMVRLADATPAPAGPPPPTPGT